MLRSLVRIARLLPCASLLLLAALMISSGSPAGAQEWTVNKARSTVSFQFNIAGQPIEGQFGAYKVEMRLDTEEPDDGEMAVTIDAGSARTGDAQRDALLFSPQGLSGSAYPAIRLTSRGIEEVDAGSYRMQADLTIRGVTKPVSVPLAIEGEGPDSRVRAEIRASQNAFGIGGGMAEDFLITLDLAATHLTN
jgi:polyisoprenoid-binding protein YceI